MRNAEGFTLLQLVVVILVGVILFTVALLIVGKDWLFPRRSDRHRGICRNNLKSLGVGLLQYSGTSDENGPFPILDRTFTNPHAELNANTGTDDPNLCSGGWFVQGRTPSPLGQNAMQNMWLLIKAGLAEERHFRCPLDRGWTPRPNAPGKQAPWKYGWTDLSQFSYGIQYPYDPNGNSNPACPFNKWSTLDEKLVIMADRNPGGSVGPGRKPSNHPDGEAVLYRGLSADFYESTQDSKASYHNDDIYVNNHGQPGAIPVYKGDSGHLETGMEDVSITPYPSRK
jgi:hypothetical protein